MKWPQEALESLGFICLPFTLGFFQKKVLQLFYVYLSLKQNLIFREEVPHTQEISVSWEGEAAPEIRTSKLGQPDPVPSKKKSNRLTLSKRKKEARKYSQIYFETWLKYLL